MLAATKSIKTAVVAMNTTADKARNIDTAVTMVRTAARQGADWVQLPEMFPFLGSYDQVYQMAELEGGALFQTLSALARELNIVLFAGSVGERPDYDGLPKYLTQNAQGQRRVYNTSYVFGRDGKLLAKYRKIHLFNLNGEDGLPRYCESDGYLAGDQPVAVEIDGLKVGLSICYDLRFTQLYTALGEGRPLDVIAVPAAFTLGTGRAHWELLLRARAVENLAYVFAANQTGVHGPGKESYGHSLVIDPWGTLLTDTGEFPGIGYATISPAVLNEVRGRLPALSNRRTDVYGGAPDTPELNIVACP
jgi:deaminated glutathione amidase